MKSPNSVVYPETTTDYYGTILDDDLPLIKFDRSGPKSIEELLYEVNSFSFYDL